MHSSMNSPNLSPSRYLSGWEKQAHSWFLRSAHMLWFGLVVLCVSVHAHYICIIPYNDRRQKRDQLNFRRASAAFCEHFVRTTLRISRTCVRLCRSAKLPTLWRSFPSQIIPLYCRQYARQHRVRYNEEKLRQPVGRTNRGSNLNN